MVRLPKQTRDRLAADDALETSRVERDAPVHWKAGALAFEALAAAANAVPAPFSHLGESETDCQVYPDMESYTDSFFDLARSYTPAEKMEVYPLSSDDGPEDWYDAEMAKDWLITMAVKVLDSHDYDLASVSYGLPEITVPAGVFAAVEHVGAFEHGRFRFRFADPSSFVKACFRAYIYLLDGGSVEEALQTLVFPTSPKDGNYRHLVATHLVDYVRAETGVGVSAGEVESCLFSSVVPKDFKDLPPLFPHVWEVVRTLFWEYKDFQSFQKHVLSSGTADKVGLPSLFPCGPGAMFERSIRDMSVEVARGLSGRAWIAFRKGDPPPPVLVTRGSIVQMVGCKGGVARVSGYHDRAEAVELAALAGVVGCLASYSCARPEPLPIIEVRVPDLDVGVGDLVSDSLFVGGRRVEHAGLALVRVCRCLSS